MVCDFIQIFRNQSALPLTKSVTYYNSKQLMPGIMYMYGNINSVDHGNTPAAGSDSKRLSHACNLAMAYCVHRNGNNRVESLPDDALLPLNLLSATCVGTIAMRHPLVRVSVRVE